MSQACEPAANFSRAAVYVSQNADDAALVRRCLGGDAAGFEGLVERYQRVLFTVALRMLGDRDEATDAAQNTFVSAYRKLHTFDPNRRFFSWIYRILVNECLNVRRARRPVEPITPELAALGTPADVFEVAERRRLVQTAIRALPIEYREVIVLSYFTGLSYKEIADALQLTAKTVKSRLHTARERLGRLLVGSQMSRLRT